MKRDQISRQVATMKRLIEQGYEFDQRGKLIHRQVCREAHGPFPKDWVVHHVDANKKNNTPVNLIALPRRLHDRLHTMMRRQKIVFSRDQIHQMLQSYLRGLRRGDVNIVINVSSPLRATE